MHFVLLSYFPVSKKAVVFVKLEFYSKGAVEFQGSSAVIKNIDSPFLFPLGKVFGFLAF